MGTWPSRYKLEECRNSRPVEKMAWETIRGGNKTIGDTWPTNDTHEVVSTSFLGKLRAAIKDSPKLDLPTEAQWEYACRAKQTTAWYNGYSPADSYGYNSPANLRSIARFCMNGGYVDNVNHTVANDAVGATLGTTNGTARVGSYMPNAYGLYDMLGNVQEWCLDWYSSSITATESDPPALDPTGPRATSGQRMRKGGSFSDEAAQCRPAASRHNYSQAGRNAVIGFRLCCPASVE